MKINLTQSKPKKITIYTDGSQKVHKKKSKLGTGGWAFLILGESTHLGSNYINEVDYFECEVIAVLMALRYLDKKLTPLTSMLNKTKVLVRTDSLTLCDQINVYRKNGKLNNHYKSNVYLDALLVELDQLPYFDFEFQWLKRGSNKMNQMVDFVAKQERLKLEYMLDNKIEIQGL